MKSETTRRAALGAIAAAAFVPSSALATMPGADAELMAMGERYEPLLRQYIDAHAEWGPLLQDAHKRAREGVGVTDEQVAGGLWSAPEEVRDRFDKLPQDITVENGCDAVCDRQSALSDVMYPMEDVILEADCKTLEGLRAKGLVYLRHLLPSGSDESEFEFEGGDFERSLFYAVADLTGIRALADATEAKLTAAHKATEAAPQKEPAPLFSITSKPKHRRRTSRCPRMKTTAGGLSRRRPKDSSRCFSVGMPTAPKLRIGPRNRSQCMRAARSRPSKSLSGDFKPDYRVS